VARDEGTQALLPVKRQQKIHDVVEAAVAIEHDGRVLLVRGQRTGVLTEMWEFPTLDSRAAEPVAAETPDNALVERLRRYTGGLGVDAEVLQPLGVIRHGITNRRITCNVFRGRATTPGTSEVDMPERGWFTPTEAAQLPLAASATRILDLLAAD
jgi:adenine-specific DNA glycosylase